ncbi:ClpP/crotonase-like domain-containing protein [Mycena maculata]|uniref:ClpP/crotonase-like domain-containing protein n=1 Tax=Mycena maculata TaxID=230809 RepID=A0AAD7MQZ4_9AGAR|nr:ClpP/crotonase-like domain-containing protein [Mycena maculata]
MFRALFRFSTLALLVLSAHAARYPSFGTLQTTNSSGVMNVVINNTFSSINLFDLHVQSDLANLIEILQANGTDIRVVPESPLPFYDPGLPNMTFPVALVWNITQLPQATIAVIEGRTRGFGNEFLMSCDMRFATTAPSVLLAQLETSFGLNPGAGGGMYLAHEIGRGRAFEYVLASKDIDGATAARYGWINRAFDTSAELRDYVQALAARIALFPAAGIAGAKKGINAVSRPSMDVIIEYAQDIIEVLAETPAAQALSEKFIAATHNQSICPLELNYGEELVTLFQ